MSSHSYSSFLLFVLSLAVVLPSVTCTCTTHLDWISRQGNNVNFSCPRVIYYRSTTVQGEDVTVNCGGISGQHTLKNVVKFNHTRLTLNDTNGGNYICPCTNEAKLFPIPSTFPTTKSIQWGKQEEIDCRYPHAYVDAVTIVWGTPIGHRYLVTGSQHNNHIDVPWYNHTGSSFVITSFNPLLNGNYACLVMIPGCGEHTATNINVTLEPNNNIDSRFVNNTKHQIIGPQDMYANITCSANVSNYNEFIAFEMFGQTQNISLESCRKEKGTFLTCQRTFNDINVTMTCNYSIPYRITCDFKLRSTVQQLVRSISTVACHIKSSSSIKDTDTNTTTGLVIRNNNLLEAPSSLYDNENKKLLINITFPFDLPPSFQFNKLILYIKNENTTNVTDFDFTDNFNFNKSDTIQLSMKWNTSGMYSFSYNVSFFGEECETSNSSSSLGIPESQVTVTPTTSTNSVTSTNNISFTNTMNTTPTYSNVEPKQPIQSILLYTGASVGAIIVALLFACLVCLIFCGSFLKYKKKKQLKFHHPSTNAHHESGLPTNDIDTRGSYVLTNMDSSPYRQNHLAEPSMYNQSMNNSAMSLIYSEHPSHICNCSCHSHSSGPSHSSAASYHSQSRLTEDLPRYGYPATAPMYYHTQQSSFDRQDEMIDVQHNHAPRSHDVMDITRRNAPKSLDLTRPHDIPSLNVVQPTPVMVNENVTLSDNLSPTDTEPFGSEPNTPANEDTDNPVNKRPTKLNIPKQDKESSATTPVSDNIMLAVMLFLQHSNCNDRENCNCCKMITKQFEKIAKDLGKDTLDRAIKDIQTPGTEKHRQLLRRKGRTPARSPHRVGFHLGIQSQRNRSSSTSEVHDNELTFSSTETEDEDKSVVRKSTRRYNSRKAYTDDELENYNSRKAITDDELDRGDETEREKFFLPLSALDKENIQSEPDLTPTPVIALPPSMTLHGITPTNNNYNRGLLGGGRREDSFPSSDESGSTDDSSTSSRPSSNPQLDNINISDSSSTNLLLNPHESTKYNDDSSHTAVDYSNTNKTNELPNGHNLLQPHNTDTDHSSDNSDFDTASPAHLLPQKSNNSKKPSKQNKKVIQIPPSLSPSNLSPQHSRQHPCSKHAQPSKSPIPQSSHPPSIHSHSSHSSHSNSSYSYRLPNSHSPHPPNSHSPNSFNSHRSTSPYSSTSRHNTLPQNGGNNLLSAHPSTNKRHHKADNGSIHSSQSVRDYYNSDQSSSGSTQSVHSEGALNGCYRYNHHPHSNPPITANNKGAHYGSSTICLPKIDSTATPL